MCNLLFPEGRSLKSLLNLLEYSSKYRNNEVLFDPIEVSNHVGSILAARLDRISAVSDVDESEDLNPRGGEVLPQLLQVACFVC